MIDIAVKDYIRLMDSITFPQADKVILEKNLLKQITETKKETSKKYVVAASAVAVIAVGVIFAAREKRQDYKLN